MRSIPVVRYYLTIVNESGGSGLYQYSKDGGTTWQNSDQFVVPSGIYNIRMRDVADPNCFIIINANFAVTQPNPLSGTVAYTNVSGCYNNANGTITVSNVTGGSGQYEYSYNGGGGWTTNNTRTQLSARVYDVRLRDRNDPNCFIIRPFAK